MSEVSEIMSGSVKLKCADTYEENCKILVKKLTNGFGVLTDWESDSGRRVYYTHPEYPGYEFHIRTWNVSEFNDNSVLIHYTVFREKLT
jgi:hypothetical protein